MDSNRQVLPSDIVSTDHMCDGHVPPRGGTLEVVVLAEDVDDAGVGLAHEEVGVVNPVCGRTNMERGVESFGGEGWFGFRRCREDDSG